MELPRRGSSRGEHLSATCRGRLFRRQCETYSLAAVLISNPPILQSTNARSNHGFRCVSGAPRVAGDWCTTRHSHVSLSLVRPGSVDGTATDVALPATSFARCRPRLNAARAQSSGDTHRNLLTCRQYALCRDATAVALHAPSAHVPAVEGGTVEPARSASP